MDERPKPEGKNEAQASAAPPTGRPISVEKFCEIVSSYDFEVAGVKKKLPSLEE